MIIVENFPTVTNVTDYQLIRFLIGEWITRNIFTGYSYERVFLQNMLKSSTFYTDGVTIKTCSGTLEYSAINDQDVAATLSTLNGLSNNGYTFTDPIKPFFIYQTLTNKADVAPCGIVTLSNVRFASFDSYQKNAQGSPAYRHSFEIDYDIKFYKPLQYRVEQLVLPFSVVA